MVRVPTHRVPTHPGKMLLEEFLKPMGISQKCLATHIHIHHSFINKIINGHKGITPDIALRLAKFFDISVEFWMNLQLRWDLYQAQQRQNETRILETIHPYSSMGKRAH
ncbi:addiction module antidote protein, HigA family [Beggiatoa alba B18LD]|uniref:Addiction module antidote protein, HigA family n=1 Tax=Beggiatoa alba B18LD TaxID=395493 RepID=I3CGN0_9GAMM|nr:HigA family addiction module antitoxin [Beggiatoa alba]EIJ42773.1 addiction module antidote protein, HigA family [Beggiatoa alba B18LD]